VVGLGISEPSTVLGVKPNPFGFLPRKLNEEDLEFLISEVRGTTGGLDGPGIQGKRGDMWPQK